MLYWPMFYWPTFKVFSRVFWFPFGWNNIQLDLFRFNVSLFALNQFVRSSRSEFIFLYKSCMYFDDKNTVVSSAKYINLECVKAICYVIYLNEKK